MEFSNELFPKVLELTLILVSYITGPDGHIDLDRFSQAEALSDLFHAVLSTCGDCPFLESVKFLWRMRDVSDMNIYIYTVVYIYIYLTLLDCLH